MAVECWHATKRNQRVEIESAPPTEEEVMSFSRKFMKGSKTGWNMKVDTVSENFLNWAPYEHGDFGSEDRKTWMRLKRMGI